nr:uncharacterized protein LOC112018316 [Quercus suber]
MEMKLGGSKANEVTNRLPFDGAIHIETIGYFSGLWLLWNEDKVEIEELAKTDPRNEKRCILWNNLNKVAELHKKSWILVGDFNEPLVQEDKFGGRGVSVNRSLAYKDCLDLCNMVDMGFFGPRYTWTNNWDVNNLILERIDCFFMNSDSCGQYPDAKVTHLPCCHSDHCPVLMETLPFRTVHLNRPFRFQEFWPSDMSFPIVVSSAWSCNRNLAESIEVFSEKATLWNKNHFKNIHQKNRRIMARIYGVQKTISNWPSSSLLNLKNQLHQELEGVLDQERVDAEVQN